MQQVGLQDVQLLRKVHVVRPDDAGFLWKGRW